MPTPIDVINQFCSLFDGNHDAVGTEEGGCRRMADPQDWFMEVEGHLRYADCQVGVYPMVHTSDGEWVVKWGCVDFDEGEEKSWISALNLRNVLEALDIHSWIERSRSKGYHVWIFLDEWTEADLVRRALLAACQIAGVSTKEVNPKQSELQPGQLGNYVRLPYPGRLAAGYLEHVNGYPKRVMVAVDDLPYSLGWFLDVAVQTLTTQKQLVELAWYYIAPNSYGETKPRDWSTSALYVTGGDMVDRLRGKARIIFEQGPLESPDSPTNYRGQTLFKLACLLAEDGRHTPEEALELLRDADVRWGKFHERNDGEQRLVEMRDKAFNR